MEALKALIQRLTWPAVVFLVVAGAAFFYYTLDRSALEARVGEIESTQTQIDGLQKKLAEAKQFELEFEQKKKQIAELNRQLLALQGALPITINVPELLQDLVKEAKNLEFEISSITPEAKEEQQELYSTLAVNIEFRGIFHQMLIYLDRLAALKRVVNVVGLNATRDTSRADLRLGGIDGLLSELDLGGGLQAYPAVNGKIRLVTYKYKPAAQAAEAAPATPAAGEANAKK